MNLLQTSLVAPEAYSTLRDALHNLEIPARKGHFGFVCVLLNSWTQSFRILDWEINQAQIEELLNNRDFRLFDWEMYRKTNKFPHIQSKVEATLTLRSKNRETRQDLKWIEAAFERIEMTGEDLFLPEKPEYFHFNYSTQRKYFEFIEFGLANAKISGD